MQKHFHELSDADRHLARRVALTSFAVYGSILAGFVLFTAAGGHRDVNLASAEIVTSAPAKSAPH
ncbi:hypothetical protein JQ604_20595 [Bradyrhizobium jicamae]|uniref:hypothetical protein n=1 Tax=Bradyrhizobium jicamae TaxID=280332 RepID=UPI001BADAA95|nr:hypothetical protein [Bradyrhizobium jicamae]MBR0754591.1 hypothetical protein [Bradyrhizobium jicamae]